MYKVDVVIPFRNSPRTGNDELRYTLRGIEKHLCNAGRVHIIGDYPKFVSNYTYTPFEEKNWYQHLTRNIYQKLLTACNIDSVSDPFLYMNDDHFLIRNCDATSIPFYHQGSRWDVGTGNYKVTIRNTLNIYPNARNFDVHAPMLIFKDRFIRSMMALNWKADFGYCIKTAYCEYHNQVDGHNTLKGEFFSDLKIDRPPTQEDFHYIEGRTVFSVGDRGMGKEMKEYLNQLYPTKSKYEI
jgi:hypothetical protein